ncbi:DUF4832 domain-containing protein [Spirosoma sp. KUDC1026]|uniref:DUF4832 domain-containing protein n=1 Tax=Spirosoma sp. KUDC1026 TaxID=2745947 RepID=UPI00159B985E|nr:DUF4832 domain-containing protein [Spirosoma sp. KUDC1026]QKZ13907.1 DUF4832 domain-containing protein [Spirosoma sp. KUDC1026]
MKNRAKFLVLGGLLVWNASFSQTKHIVYKESLADFPNPERGFYIPFGTSTENFKPLDKAVLLNYRRQPQQSSKASYSFFCSLIYRAYRLERFKTSPIDADFLQKIQADANTARSAGVKLILRFSYTDKTHSGDCPDEYKICPPYGDASKPVVLAHIAQLKPLLQKNADVIAVLQMGFIGIWGENYFTDYFGDASLNHLGVVPDSSWRDRNEVLNALLDALPKERMVQVRTPQIKQRFVSGPQAPVAMSPMSEKEAFSQSTTARIGFHNDCFLASADDYGTFYDYGNSSSKRGPANEWLRRYFEADSRYTAVGGETCDDAFSPQNDCAPIGRAEQEMAAMHYSYLNAAYNNDVNNDWHTDGCMAKIRRNLGYRFVLEGATLPTKVRAGQALTCEINLKNVGYASPYNPRPLQLLLRHTTTKAVTVLNSQTDVRKWFSGPIQWRESITLPAGLQTGQYELLLNLPDAYASLANRSEYSIRLANEAVWEATTGYNRLNHTLVVEP